MGALPWVRADDIRPYEAQHRKAGKCADERTGKMAPSGRELAAPKGSLREQAGGKVTQLPEHRPPPVFTATLHGSAHCANALGYLLQAPSEPTYVGPPPSLREALGWGILQVSASFEIRAGGTPHLLPIHYYFLPSKNRPIGFREE